MSIELSPLTLYPSDYQRVVPVAEHLSGPSVVRRLWRWEKRRMRWAGRLSRRPVGGWLSRWLRAKHDQCETTVSFLILVRSYQLGELPRVSQPVYLLPPSWS